MPLPRPAVARLLALALAVSLAACDSRPGLPGEPEPLCSEEVVEVTVEVVDAGGTPLTDLRARSVILTTGELLSIVQGSEDGFYAVASDRNADAFADGSRIVRFTASNEDLLAQADFVFTFDGCHIVKESGPTRVTARLRG